MTFHDYNRLQAHLPEWLREQNLFLDLTTQLMAGDIAIKINVNTGLYSVSAETLAQPDKDNPHSKRGTKKTWLTHMTTLEEVGLFRTKRLRQRQARFWELAIPCPPSCVGEDFENHNSRQRIKQLEQQARVVDNSNQKSNLGDQKSKDYSTNREYIDIDDIEIQFSNLGLGEFITWVISQLPELNDQHNSLLGYIDTNKAEVETKALAILKKRNPTFKGKYLASVVTNTPAELFTHLITKATKKSSSKSVATIHTTPTKARVSFTKIKGFTSSQLGFEITEASKWYLINRLKQGLAITSKDLVICQAVEQHNLRLTTEGVISNNLFIQLELIKGKPKAFYEGGNHNWNSETTTATDHLEHLRNELTNLYDRLPETPLEAYDLEGWIISNWTIEEDRKEFEQHYPEKPTGVTWPDHLTEEALAVASQRGYSLDQLNALADTLPRNTASWAAHKQFPHTWLNNLPDRTPRATDSDQIDLETTNQLADLVQALSKP